MRRSIFFSLATVLTLSHFISILPAGASAEAVSQAMAQAGSTTAQPVQPPAELKPAVPPAPAAQRMAPRVVIILTDPWIAYKTAADPWLYKAAAVDPAILAAICEHPWAARRLAKNRHLGELADCDHYLCRRLTRWRGATWALVKNPEADHVIALDPEGIYRAIRRDPTVSYQLARHPLFNQMIVENPDLGDFIARHM